MKGDSICISTTDYINNYIFENDKPVMYLFPGGYYSFDDKGNMDGCHFYVQDYQGNNRMVVNADSKWKEQVNHYYSYGGLIGVISTKPDKQDFKYSGKEFDRTYGIDLYDFHARQYDPIIPGFNSIDPMAEKYYGISPYAYCAGDPVNCVDPTGCSTKVVLNDSTGCYDVIGGDLTDGDKRIYIYAKDEDGNEVNTEIVLGMTPTMTSFYNPDSKKFQGSINITDQSGKKFLSDIQNQDVYEDRSYWLDARNGKIYDFKASNYDKKKKKVPLNYYRGMPIGEGVGGLTVYSSARDIGNMAAGFVARKQGMSWSTLRFCFDAYESRETIRYQRYPCSNICYFSGWKVEGVSSQNGQKYGYYGLLKLK